VYTLHDAGSGCVRNLDVGTEACTEAFNDGGGFRGVVLEDPGADGVPLTVGQLPDHGYGL
jgi:hypothetical protein